MFPFEFIDVHAFLVKMADKYLFEKSLLDSPRFQSIFEAHPHLEVRPLSLADYDRGKKELGSIEVPESIQSYHIHYHL